MLFFVWLCPTRGEIEIVVRCQLNRCTAQGAHTSPVGTIAYALYGHAIAPQAAAPWYTVPRDSVRTANTRHAIAVRCTWSRSPSMPPRLNAAAMSAPDLTPVREGVARCSIPTPRQTHRPEGRPYYSDPTSICEDRGKRANGKGPGVTSILLPISPQTRSQSPFPSLIAVLPSWSPSDAFLVPDDKSIVLEFRSAPTPLLVRLARFYGGMLS